jgi:hypothetical protein
MSRRIDRPPLEAAPFESAATPPTLRETSPAGDDRYRASGRQTTLALRYLEKHESPMKAYMALQVEVLQRLAERRQMSLLDICERWSPTFAVRFRWMCDDHKENISARSRGVDSDATETGSDATGVE